MIGKKAICSVVATAMIFAIAFSGVAVALQSSFNVATVDGTVRAQTRQTTATYGNSSYDSESYNLDVFAVHSAQFSMSHMLDGDSGIEAENALSYIPASDQKLMFMDEQVKKARVAKGSNESVCYAGRAGASATAQMLGYQSAAIVGDSNLAFAASAVGVGKFSAIGEEEAVHGDNNTYTQSVSLDEVKVRYGAFNTSAMFKSEIPTYPAMAPPREAVLCPFA